MRDDPAIAREARILAIAAGGAIAVLGATVLSRAGEEVYAIPGWGVAVTAGLLAAGLAGAALVAWGRRPGLSAGVLAGAALAVFGFLAILSVGLLALLAGVALLAAALGRSAGPRRLAAAGGATLAGAALPVLLALALDGPVVECERDGASAGENLFMSLGSDEAESGMFSALDRSGGSARGETYEYRFACQDGRLVEFDFRWR